MKTGKRRKDFPLFKHDSGQWAKKVRGRTCYFGTDRATALSRWLDDRDDLLAGRVPRRQREGLTVQELINRFLHAKRSLMLSGELTARTWNAYYITFTDLAEHWGRTRVVGSLGPEDFEELRSRLAAGCGPVTLANLIQRVRTLFKFAFDEGLVPTPVRFGSVFKKPSRKIMRKARHDGGAKMFEAAEVRKLIDSATVQMRAMILLGVNCGFGQTDAALLPLKALNLKGGRIDHPRPKTQVARRCHLWPVTLEALRAVIRDRPEPADPKDSALVFITTRGRHRWVRIAAKQDENGKDLPSIITDSVAVEFGRLRVSDGRHVHNRSDT